jgi:peptide/nickel transport system substrate-binding protein
MPFFCPIAANAPPQEIHDPLGSGPYYIASRVPNRQTVLRRNAFYWGPRPASVDRVIWSVGLGFEACREAEERNATDYCVAGIPSAEYAELAAMYGINKKDGQFFFSPTLSTFYFAFNHDRPAFKGQGQIPLKQAINWALDRPSLVRTAGYLGGKRTDQILPPAMARAASIYALGGVTDRSLAKARALLAKAKLKPTSLVLYTRTIDGPRVQIFQFNLKRLGIDVDVKYFSSFGPMLPRAGVRGEPYDVIFAAWFATTPIR